MNVLPQSHRDTEKKEDKLEKIAERVYNASFVITVILIVAASIGTAIARYTLDSKIELVPDNVFKFIERILWIFALPVSIKIIGDKLPLVVQAIMVVRGQGGLSPYQTGYQFSNNEPNNTNYSSTGVDGFSRGLSQNFNFGASHEAPTANPNTYF